MVATGGPSLATTKCVVATAVATGEAAMGSVVATGGLPGCPISYTAKLMQNNFNRVINCKLASCLARYLRSGDDIR